MAYGPVGLLDATLGASTGALPEVRAYNDRTWLSSLKVGSSGSVYSLNPNPANPVTYAGDGDVISVTDSVNGTWTYAYDDFNRLAQATNTSTSPNQIYTYAYDRFGNRWQQNYVQGQGLGWPMSLTFNGNNQVTMTGYVYDAAGNVVMDFQNCYAYDAENRLNSVAPVAPGGRSCGGITMSYLYDPDGRRVARLQNGAMVKQDYYDSAGIEIAETDGNGNLLRAEIYAGSRHLATWTNNATYFNHADGLGTERVRTFTSGQYAGKACETITSLPFGDGLATQPANGGCGDPSPDHFTGLERDAESGLDHTLNRQFASSYGRWLTPDPASVKAITLADPQTWNMYEYAHNNPTTVTDPSGLGSPVDLGFAGGGGEGAPPDPFAEYHVIGIPPDNDPVRKPAGEKPHDQPFNPIITYDRNLSPAELAAAKTKVEGAVGLVNSKWGSLSEAQQRTLKQLAGIHVFTGRRGGMDFKAMTLNLSFGDNVNESSLARLGSDIAHDSFHITQYFNGQYMTHDKKALLRNESQAVHFQIPVCQALGCTKQEIRDLRHFEAHPEEGWGWWAQ